MTVTITAFEWSPDGGKGLCGIRASLSWACPARFALFRFAR
jgi:hypothetical protein